MKAWVLHDIGDFRCEEMDKPEPAEGEVLVRVMAAGVCGSDIPRIYRTGAHRMPLIPGHEFSGVVVEDPEEGGGEISPTEVPGASGDDVLSRAARTDSGLGLTDRRVGVFPLIPCRRCECCLAGQYELCRNYDYIGSRRDGAFAEYVSVPRENLIRIPDGMSFEAAAMLEPMAVAVHAMRIGLGAGACVLPSDDSGKKDPSTKKSVRVAICGLGTIGLLLVSFLRDAGYENLFLIGNKAAQFDRAEGLGFDRGRMIDFCSEDPAARLRALCGGIDVFFECVGKQESLSLGVDIAAPNGRVVTVGNPYGDMTLSRDIYWKILRNQLTIAGTWNSSFRMNDASRAGKVENIAEQTVSDDDWRYAIRRVAAGGVVPEQLITHRLALEELTSGLTVMRDKSEDYCKVMMVTEEHFTTQK